MEKSGQAITQEYVLICPSLAIGGSIPVALSLSLCDSGNSMNIMHLILFHIVPISSERYALCAG